LTHEGILRAFFGAKYALFCVVTTTSDPLPADLASAHAMILAQRALLEQEQSARIMAQSEAKVRALEIERLKLLLAKARREQFGQSSERGKLLIEQLELAIEDLEETQAEDETRAEIAAPAAKEKRVRPPRGPRKLPDNLPVERVVEPAPCACGKCGGVRLRKLGEVVSKTLECEPRRWKIVEHVREKFSCRDCEAISEPPAPSHPIPRGFAGPSLLAMVLAAKFLDHQPLNRQSAAFAREGVEIDTSTLADWVGSCAGALEPIVARLREHILAAERIHADDTTVPVLAKTKTKLGRIWVYLRDDRPFGGRDPPAAFFEYSPSRHGAYPRQHLAAWSGVMQADAFPGFNDLYDSVRKPAPIAEAACWAHGRREFFKWATLAKSPVAQEVVRRIDELFAIERAISGKPADERRTLRQERSRPLAISLEAYLHEQRSKLSPKHDLAKAMSYILTRWEAFTRFLDDGRVCLSNNAAERALRGVAIGRRNWTFAGSDEGGRRAAAIYTLVQTCKLNDVDPQAWLAFALAKLPDHPAKKVDELLPWNWKAARVAVQPTPAAAAA
jgi:transposase